MERVTRRIAAIQNPAHTGENRCYPCTVLNLGILLGIAVLFAIVRLELAILSIVVGLSTIYVRGYLVPGTPTITQRYFPERVLRVFGKHSEAVQQGSDFDVEGLLTAHDIIRPNADGTDVTLNPDIATALETRFEQYRSEDVRPERIAALFDVAPEDITIRSTDPPALRVRGRYQSWPSTAALLSDTAADAVLRERIASFPSIQLDHRLQVVTGIRAMLNSCPACDGEVALDERTVRSCCSSREVIRLRCVECESTIFEINAERIPDE